MLGVSNDKDSSRVGCFQYCGLEKKTANSYFDIFCLL